jgi:hypothetical protein
LDGLVIPDEGEALLELQCRPGDLGTSLYFVLILIHLDHELG